MEENKLTSSQIVLRFAVVFFITIWALTFMAGCATYQPVDKCCETDVVYLDDLPNDSVSVFTNLEFKTITLDFRPRFYRGSDWYWGRTYNYWGSRPLWMDFDFYYGNYYSYSNPYYSLWHRPWNYWDWYMRPWRPYNNWYQGPFNNQSYNVVYNASRRGNLTSNISNRTRNNKRPVVVNNSTIKFVPNQNKPSTNNTIRVRPNNNWKPSNNNYKPNNNSRPVINNSRPPINNSRSSINNSRPTRSNIKPRRNQ